MFMLMHVDDTDRFVNSEMELQKQLDNLSDFCNEWEIHVNTDKTKTCLFSRRKSMRNFNFKCRNKVLEAVDTFNHLAITFCYTDILVQQTTK